MLSAIRYPVKAVACEVWPRHQVRLHQIAGRTSGYPTM